MGAAAGLRPGQALRLHVTNTGAASSLVAVHC